MSDEPIVEFKVKDLFLEIKNDLSQIKRSLDHKADKSEVEKLELQVNALKDSVNTKAAIDDVLQNNSAIRRTIVGWVITTLISLGALVLAFARH